MKSAKSIIAVLLMFSLLFLGWTQKNKYPVDKVEKILKPALDITNALSFINSGIASLTEKINKVNITLNYTKLKLSKDEYNKFSSGDQFIKPTIDADKNENSGRKKNVIVFQFAYISEVYPYPALRAYPMRVKDHRTGNM